jgi:uncharacterized protein YjiS (DUF1127 family)
MSMHRSSGFSAPVSAMALMLTAVSVVRRVLKVVANRRAVNRLTQMDERQLKDIGLTRADVVGALAEPIYRDPSRCLAERTGGARSLAARRGTADGRPVMPAATLPGTAVA